jgi:hypothetical protein
MLLLAPILSFFGYQHYASTHYPSMGSSERGTYAGIYAAVSIFCVMVAYVIMAIREKD